MDSIVWVVQDTFRSTPPREGRRDGYRTVPVEAEVSIHAPTRGATVAQRHFLELLAVSIHAPTRGATPSSSATTARCEGFDPRPHARGDFAGA